jgi:sRNA-binding carbon storage regulator CsrA
MGLVHKVEVGGTVKIGDNITITVRERTRGNSIWLDICAPRAVPIETVKAQKPQDVDDSCD